MKILIGADLVPTQTNIDLFKEGNIEKLLGNELIQELNEADMRIFNLETPLIEKNSPIKKVGPTLGIDTEVINGIKRINPSFLTLANNHILDHGALGLKTTMNVLNQNQIEYGGIGENENDANKIWIEQINGKKIGIYACVEHEFSVATENSMGANPFDYINSYKCIQENKEKCDFIIVLYHGGKEYYPYPSPNLQKICRNFIDCGADIVVCQHSHCIGCEEDYKNKKIVYGQGNFLFDKTNREEWNHGLLLKLNISDTQYDMDYIVTTKEGNCIRKANKDEYSEEITKYKERSGQILGNDFVKENYRKFALDNISEVLIRTDYVPHTLLAKILNKLTNKKSLKFYLKNIYLKKMSYILANVIECEAWNELLKEIVSNYNREE